MAAPRERDAFEDGERMHEAVFAEIGAPSMPASLGNAVPALELLDISVKLSMWWENFGAGHGRPRRGKDLQVEGRFISNVNAFGRWSGFRRIRDSIFQQQEKPSRLNASRFCAPRLRVLRLLSWQSVRLLSRQSVRFLSWQKCASSLLAKCALFLQWTPSLPNVPSAVVGMRGLQNGAASARGRASSGGRGGDAPPPILHGPMTVVFRRKCTPAAAKRQLLPRTTTVTGACYCCHRRVDGPRGGAFWGVWVVRRVSGW